MIKWQVFIILFVINLDISYIYFFLKIEDNIERKESNENYKRNL